MIDFPSFEQKQILHRDCCVTVIRTQLYCQVSVLIQGILHKLEKTHYDVTVK